jgi:hypothetical protein
MSKDVYKDKEQMDAIISRYQAADSDQARAKVVAAVATEIGRNVQSVISKLVREGVYIAKTRTAKNGAPIETKSSMVDRIASKFDIEFTDGEAMSLEKATKSTLRKILGE